MSVNNMVYCFVKRPHPNPLPLAGEGVFERLPKIYDAQEINHPTRDTTSPQTMGAAILAAAMALPGLAVHAESAPDKGIISFKYMDYQDSQPGLKRIGTRSPSLSVMAPIAGVWSLEGSLISDDVSGASPMYHTAISGASKMQDQRTAADVRVTRYFPRGTLAFGLAYSTEHDYDSRAVSLQGTVSSEDKNTTWGFGAGYASDRINPVNFIVTDESKKTADLMLGVTQVLTAQDLLQINLTHARGRGYFSDPYKLPDNRPRERSQSALMGRWNHHFSGTDGTSRISYRYYTDTFGIKAHTLSGEYVQPFAQGWSVTPSLRLYTQSAASFYFDPVYDATLGAPFPPGYVFGDNRLLSPDQRLSAFGAATIGIKLAKQLGKDWLIDLKLDQYEQRSGLRIFGKGSPGLDPFRARSILFGISRQW